MFCRAVMMACVAANCTVLPLDRRCSHAAPSLLEPVKWHVVVITFGPLL